MSHSLRRVWQLTAPPNLVRHGRLYQQRKGGKNKAYNSNIYRQIQTNDDRKFWRNCVWLYRLSFKYLLDLANKASQLPDHTVVITQHIFNHINLGTPGYRNMILCIAGYYSTVLIIASRVIHNLTLERDVSAWSPGEWMPRSLRRIWQLVVPLDDQLG